ARGRAEHRHPFAPEHRLEDGLRSLETQSLPAYVRQGSESVPEDDPGHLRAPQQVPEGLTSPPPITALADNARQRRSPTTLAHSSCSRRSSRPTVVTRGSNPRRPLQSRSAA